MEGETARNRPTTLRVFTPLPNEMPLIVSSAGTNYTRCHKAPLPNYELVMHTTSPMPLVLPLVPRWLLLTTQQPPLRPLFAIAAEAECAVHDPPTEPRF